MKALENEVFFNSRDEKWENEWKMKKAKNIILTLQISESDNILNYNFVIVMIVIKVHFRHEIRETGGISNGWRTATFFVL